jgi:predicted Zn-dependent protease
MKMQIKTKPWKNLAMIALVAILALLTGCSSTQLGQLVEAGMLATGQDPESAAQARQAASSLSGALVPVDEETERSLGSGVAVQAYSTIGKRHPNEALQRYVNLVGRTVAANSDRPDLPYTFAVLENSTPNAFAGPGGYIFITTGSLSVMKSEAELAGVLAHEVAHVSRKHILRTYRRASMVGALQQSAAAMDANITQYTSLVDAASDTLFDKGLDQRFEYEADLVGTEIAAVTGYDPRGLLVFLSKLNKISSAGGGWFKTHPPMDERINRLNQFLTRELGGEKGIQQSERFQRTISAHLR